MFDSEYNSNVMAAADAVAFNNKEEYQKAAVVVDISVTPEGEADGSNITGSFFFLYFMSFCAEDFLNLLGKKIRPTDRGLCMNHGIKLQI